MAGNPSWQSMPASVLYAISRHKGKALSFFVITLATVFLYTRYTPRTYRSEGKLFIRLGRENSTLDPTVMVGGERAVVTSQSRDPELNSVTEILSSRMMLEKVVDAVGPEKILHARSGSSVGEDEPANSSMLSHATHRMKAAMGVGAKRLSNLLGNEELDEREQAIQRLGWLIAVGVVPKSNVVDLYSETATPELSQTIVSKLMEFFIDEHIRLNRLPGEHEVLAEQTERLRYDLQRAEEQLRDLKNETGLFSPIDQRPLLAQRNSRLQDELLQTSASMAFSGTLVQQLLDKIKTVSETTVTAQTSGMTNEGTDAMRQHLFTLQTQAQELRSKYTDNHFKIRELETAIAAAQKILRQEQETRTHITTGPSKIYEEGQVLLLKEGPQLASLQAKSESIKNQIAEVQQQIKAFNDNSLRITQLERSVGILEQDYLKHTRSLEQARLDEALQRQRISNVSVIQPASFEAKPVRPRAAVNLLLATASGLLGGLFLALLMEWLDRSIKTPRDIEEKLDLPTFVSIPRLHRKQLALNGRD